MSVSGHKRISINLAPHYRIGASIQSAPLVRALLCEDSILDLHLLLEALDVAPINCELVHVSDLFSLQQQLQSQCFDILITDYHLLAATADDVIRLVRQSTPELPMIVVSWLASAEQVRCVLECGARDFISKDQLAGLPRAISQVLARQDQ